MSDNTILQSLKTLIDPKTIPFLISQGVVPKLLPVVTATIGLALGFLWAYVLSPVVFTGGAPVNLSPSYQQEFIKQVAWQYDAYKAIDPTAAVDNAKKQLSWLGDAKEQYDALVANTSGDANLQSRLQEIQGFAVDDPNVLRSVQVGFFSNLMPILCILGILIIPGLAVVVNTIIPITLLFQPKSKEKDTTPGTEGERRKALAAAQAAVAAAPPPPATAATINRGAPIAQYMSSYIMGDDLYDDSFAIETPSDEFLGETGAGISKTIGVGDPKKVTATEVWVFDKTDIKTLTKVLMSEHAYNDEALRAELAPKGEAVPIQPGSIVLLETQALTVQARVVDMAYGSGSLPTNSFFERLTVEISAWPKKAGDSTAGAGDAGSAGAPPPPPSTLPGTGNTFDTTAPDAFGDTSALNR